MTLNLRFKKRLSRLLPSQGFGRSVAALAGGTATAQALTVAFMPLITRLYLPSEIGVIVLFTAFSSFWGSLLSFRYELALLNMANEDDAHLIAIISVILVVAMSFISVPVLYSLMLTHTMGFGYLPYWAPIFGMFILTGIGIFAICRMLTLRNSLIGVISGATVVQSVSNSIWQVALGLIGGGVGSLFFARLFGTWSALEILRRNLKKYNWKEKTISWPEVKTLMLRYSKFPKYEAPSTFLNNFISALPVPMLTGLQGIQAAGWYGLARSLVAIPNTQIGNAVADTFHMTFSRLMREGCTDEAKKLFYEMLFKLSIFGLLPLISTIGLGPWLVPWIFGNPWAKMGIIAACIAPWLYAALVVSSLSRLLSVLERQEYKLLYDIFVLGGMMLVYILASRFNFDLVQTVVLFTIVNVAGYLIYLILLIRIVNKFTTINAN